VADNSGTSGNQQNDEEIYDEEEINMIDSLFLRYMRDANVGLSIGGTGVNGKTGFGEDTVGSNIGA